MNEIRTAAIFSYVTIFCTFVVSIVYTPFMIRILGQEEYGLYSLMMVLIGYFSILDLGFGNAIVRYISRNRALGDKNSEAELNGFFLKLFILIGLIAIGIGVILYSQVDNIFGGSLSDHQLGKVKMMIIFMTISLAVQFPLSVFSSILQAYERFIFIKLVSLIQVIIQPITMLIFLLQGADSVTLIGIVAVYNTLFILVDALICMKILDVKFTFTNSNQNLLKEICLYAFFIFVTVIVDKIYWQTDQLLLGILKGTVDVAIYAIAIQIVMIFMSLALAISNLYLPRISILVTQEDGLMHINHLFKKVGSIQFLIVGYVMGGFILFGKDFIALWVGKEFLQVYYIVLIIMIPFTVDLIQNLGLSVLKAKNLFRFRTILLICIALLNLMLSIPAIKYFGLLGTASITALSLLVGNGVIMNVYYHKKLKLDIKGFWLNISKLMIALFSSTITMKLLLFIFNPNITWVSLISYIILYGILLFLTLFVFGINAQQRKTLIHVAKSKIPNLLTRKVERE
ncbi:oligosaccharide flippase family protein [Lysinibacillus agricola]|uniref:Oligosaccharide flippase family protein n=1 Tax=Lysinibacillus agricola TaxID=2590012 RepID=A0ABX7AVF1_9BACI|nr:MULTISPECIES: oligosaccharide flippase family protein [Lysinibacillus]KOS62735.1 polysaccharide biosynthesis protein [Lysinibacillus sp. FJAT-14222]QQP13706.1 oligosaccharide flippase family protein [Lysinibacillus agricola]